MRVLILSCNTGEGHNSCAKAIKEVFDSRDETCVIEDALRFISERTYRFISWGHVFVYRNLPWLFNWGYGFAEKHPSFFKEKSCIYNFFAKGSDALSEFIAKEGYDTVICTHPFASLMLTETQRRYGLPIRTAFVATDYTCSPSVKDSRLDYYFIPNENLIGDFECPNIPKEKIVVSGIPIKQIFYGRREKDEAKRAVGIEPSRKHIVVMCGSMGCGNMEKPVNMLTARSKEGFDLTVVCGTNGKLKARLERKYGDRKNLHVCGYFNDMSALLDSADLYITKAGGISITEAAAKDLPMVYIKAIAGCEDCNRKFYTDFGGAIAASGDGELIKICSELLIDANGYSQMQSSLRQLKKRNASQCIYSTLKEGEKRHSV